MRLFIVKYIEKFLEDYSVYVYNNKDNFNILKTSFEGSGYEFIDFCDDLNRLIDLGFNIRYEAEETTPYTMHGYYEKTFNINVVIDITNINENLIKSLKGVNKFNL